MMKLINLEIFFNHTMTNKKENLIIFPLGLFGKKIMR